MTETQIERMVPRPADASVDALRNCIAWLDACMELRWPESELPKLESLWWTYHDKDGHRKELLR